MRISNSIITCDYAQEKRILNISVCNRIDFIFKLGQKIVDFEDNSNQPKNKRNCKKHRKSANRRGNRSSGKCDLNEKEIKTGRGKKSYKRNKLFQDHIIANTAIKVSDDKSI